MEINVSVDEVMAALRERVGELEVNNAILNVQNKKLLDYIEGNTDLEKDEKVDRIIDSMEGEE